MSITSKVKQSVVLTADGQVQALVNGSAADITKCNIMSIFAQSSAADAEVKIYNEIGDAKTALEYFQKSMSTPDNLGEKYHPLQGRCFCSRKIDLRNVEPGA